MRSAWGIVCVMALLVGGCASQSGSQQQGSTMAGGESSGGGEQQASAADPSAVTPERQDAVERAFQRKTTELQECWSKEYEKTHDRKLEGDLTIGMDIAPNGSPSNVRILKSSMNNRDVESCVTQTVSSWSFPEGQATMPYMRTVHLGAQF
jgi:outer membrane biosynthesis protein TonB